MALLIAAIAILSSCKKFLDVQPEDKVLETQLFSTKQGIKTVLNGLYINLSNNQLYGDNLTLSTIEVLAQRYNTPSTHSLTKIATYAYNDNPTMSRLENIWTNSYATVLNINAFLENVDKYPGVLDQKTENIYKGEAIAMRAFLHFDLLRLYGPRYSTVDSTKQSLSYYEATKSTVNPLLPANSFIQKIIDDLNKAETLLAEDEIIANGVNTAAANATVDFLTNNRNYRLNYYAVKGLKARVFLYRGDKVSALKYAKEVMAVANRFPWTTSTNALSEKQNPDRVFTTEMMFGIMNTQLYTRYLALFDPGVSDANILAPITARLNTVYENNENDYRFNLNWQIPTTGVKAYKTFYKYADVIDKTKVFRFSIPLLKISEMYLIAAESEPVTADGVAHLNTVRANRGLIPLAATVNINTELQKEYQKDFFGEGQLFYYYKRRNITSVPNGSASSGNVTVNYAVPMPQSEALYR
ncbi:RagB/SusD family nutrient uptake outer membrane protein [Pedobacter sp. SL55]|uniref:RagB/SusD family nutrient uptake outer membrane protein n=1 Tax=Pedobacter sp. SL55 TaxID=2995161 RepID=UPI00226E001C|nr:RagB/SusD family nutrient uptake outer membrane protein [Pedobacter sp. SL55]WAC40815.1 RagB/SusD family nutrient uptake outer membrane protein [Pedobacter sp. SL55]